MQNKKILVIDDEKDIANLISHNLKKDGHSVHCLTDPEAALIEVRKNIFYLVITDYGMPNLSGYNFLRKARNNYSYAIMVTSSIPNSEGMQLRLKKLVIEIFTKPIDMVRLRNTVGKIMTAGKI